MIDPFTRQLPESIQACSFNLSDLMTRSNRKDFFESRTMTYYCLSTPYLYHEVAIAPNRFLECAYVYREIRIWFLKVIYLLRVCYRPKSEHNWCVYLWSLPHVQIAIKSTHSLWFTNWFKKSYQILYIDKEGMILLLSRKKYLAISWLWYSYKDKSRCRLWLDIKSTRNV